MKIAALEWASGGGLASSRDDSLFFALQHEGRAMLSCLARELSRGGHQVSVALDRRLAEQAGTFLPPASCSVTFVEKKGHAEVPIAWESLANESDFAVVIAPESSGFLERVSDCLSHCKADLVNCRGAFLKQTADKLATSRACEAVGLRHPPTRLVSQVTNDWIGGVQQDFFCDHWVIKPRKGAGAEDLHIVSRHELRNFPNDDLFETYTDPDDWILQPWLAGQSFSRSAIVDRVGQWHWMPLMTQEFSTESSPKYLGGATSSRRCAYRFPRSLLDQVASAFGEGALGWVGTDWVFSNQDQQFYLVEVNPRCTTSLVGLCAAYNGNLAAELINAQLEGFTGLRGGWRPVRFRADGHVSTA